MENFPTPQFPQKRLDALLKAAQSFDWRNPPRDLRMRLDHIVHDASEAAFLARMLEHIRPGVLEVQYPELKGTRLVPTDSSFDPGAEYYTYQATDYVGSAQVGGGYSNVVPRADVRMLDGTQKIQPIKTSYAYTFQENRNAMMARRPLPSSKAQAARDVSERTADKIIFVGHSIAGLKGLLTLSGTTTYTTPAGTGGSKYWNLKTTDEVLADMNGAPNKVVGDTNEAEQPTLMVLPTDADTLVHSRRVGDGTSQNIAQYFLANTRYIKRIENSFYGKTAPNSEWTGQRMVCFRPDPSKLVAPLLAFEQLAPQANMYEIITPCHQRTAGVIALFPKSIVYGDEILA